MPTQNDTAWEQLFQAHRLLEQIERVGFCVISSSIINQCREARLMTKVDHRSNLPIIFRDNNLAILPITRGDYIIAKFETFYDLSPADERTPINNIYFPPHIQSLDYREISSESTAINCAYITRMIENFIGEENLLPTVSGRMGSSSFCFSVNKHNGELQNIQVNRSQIEIDGGYEGSESLCLIEAKNYISDNFIIRQLYYPYRLWTEKIQKRVRPVFLTYTNGIFHFREFEFTNIEHYNSLQLVRQQRYSISDSHINTERIIEIINETPVEDEPREAPFPQADSFERIINLCEILKQRDSLTKEEITLNYDFVERQTFYYTAAGIYLGLITKGAGENGESCFMLTQRGHSIFSLSVGERQAELIKTIVRRTAFRRSLELYLNNGAPPEKNEIVNIMIASNLYNISSEDTYRRRASTIFSWINWIVSLVEE